MDDEQVWTAIDDQRERVARLLDDLDDEQWDHPSLCEGWTVRDVAAHLTLQQLTLVDALRLAWRSPRAVMGVNRMIHESSRDQAARLSTEEIIGSIRATVGRRRHNVGVTHRETLIDILVHGLDIAVPLQLDLEIPPEAGAEAAARVLSTGDRGKRVFREIPLRDYRLVATDIDWSSGHGPEIAGPVGAILLLLTGRPVGLADLTGDGADLLRRQGIAAAR
jgi:uncharacterized protein (TIGR03083 family)